MIKNKLDYIELNYATYNINIQLMVDFNYWHKNTVLIINKF